MTDVAAPDSDPPGATEPPLDRTISPIAGRLSAAGGGKALAFAGLLVGCGVFAFASWSADRPRPERPPEQAARQVVAFEPAAPTLANPGFNAPALGGAGPEVPAIVPGAAELSAAAPAAAAPARSPTDQIRAAPVMAWSGGAPTRRDALAADVLPGVPALLPDAPATELDRLRQGSRIGRARARVLGDRNFLILAGATIPCVLQSALDSATSGYAACLIGVDVYSDNGAVVLLDKGTRVLGEYRGGMRQGQRRIFVLWTRAVTPAGVAIDLASPAADALGRGGFDGAVDSHFWDRFGAALLLSVVESGAEAVVAGDRHDTTLRAPSNAAGEAVQANAEIAPTLRKRQGSEVSILAAQDFDFSGVYGLRAHTP